MILCDLFRARYMELIDRQQQLEDDIHHSMSKDPNCKCVIIVS